MNQLPLHPVIYLFLLFSRFFRILFLTYNKVGLNELRYLFFKILLVNDFELLICLSTSFELTAWHWRSIGLFLVGLDSHLHHPPRVTQPAGEALLYQILPQRVYQVGFLFYSITFLLLQRCIFEARAVNGACPETNFM